MKQIEFKKNYTLNKNKLFKDISESDWNDWKWQLKNSIKTYDELIAFFPELKNDKLKEVCKKFHFEITPYYLCLIDFDSFENDGIAKQVIPQIAELERSDYLKLDPFNEKNKSPAPGVVKRYKDRALIVTTNLCASYCRYCTRKWNWETGNILSKSDLKKAKTYIKENTGIREAIISGGDPFLLAPDFLEEIISELINIPNIEVVRIATRIPSFLPQRINDEIVNILRKYKPIWIVTHFNHPDEITPETEKAIDRLIEAGATLANQTVLLKGINDNTEIMKKLLCDLEKLRIKPYYIFQCDLIEGTAHFRTPIQTGLKIMEELRGNIGGLCIPSYIVDLPDGGKVPLLPEYLIQETDEKIIFRNYEGKIFEYPKI